MSAIDIQDLMNAMRNKIGDIDDNACKPKPLPDAVIHDLRVKYALLNTRYAFKPGDIVRGKPGCAPYKDADSPHIVTAVGDEAARLMGGNMPPPNEGVNLFMKDMIVGCTTFGTFQEFAVDSRHFEPWPGQ